MTQSVRTKGVIALVAVGVGALVIGAFGGKTLLMSAPVQVATEPPAERAAQPVRVTAVAFARAREADSFTGVVRPQHETTMGFRLPGKMVARLVEVGDRVTRGQRLALLDETDAKLDLASAFAEVAAARSDFDRATADAQRSRDLFNEGHVARAALDRAASVEAEALSRRDRSARAAEVAQNRLSYCTLLADSDGVITAALAEPGQVVAAGQPVVSVAQMNALDVVFALPEQSRAILTQSSASATLWGTAGRSYALVLRDVSPDVDPVTRTYRVRMAVTAPDVAMALGRTVSVELTGRMREPVAALPLAAVINDARGASVWRLTNDGKRVERVPVEIVTLNDSTVGLTGKLADGDLVVSLGAHKIDPARPVRVVETTDQPSM